MACLLKEKPIIFPIKFVCIYMAVRSDVNLFQYFLLTNWFSSSQRPVLSVIWELKFLSSVSVVRYHSRCGNLLRNGQSADRIPVDIRFSSTVRTVPGAHTPCYTMDTASFPRVKRRGFNHPPYQRQVIG